MSRNYDHITDEIKQLMDSGHSCAEAIILSVGKEVIDDYDPSMCRLATGFRGGIGACRDEVCGAVSGGVMVIGALYGRSDPKASTERSDALVNDLRRQFIERFGSTCCRDLYQGPISCTQIVQESAVMLLSALDEIEK
jgi:C_GCAxxG_C_C family probable redox protein